jgi:hypothetical protein
MHTCIHAYIKRRTKITKSNPKPFTRSPHNRIRNYIQSPMGIANIIQFSLISHSFCLKSSKISGGFWPPALIWPGPARRCRTLIHISFQKQISWRLLQLPVAKILTEPAASRPIGIHIATKKVGIPDIYSGISDCYTTAGASHAPDVAATPRRSRCWRSHGHTRLVHHHRPPQPPSPATRATPPSPPLPLPSPW